MKSVEVPNDPMGVIERHWNETPVPIFQIIKEVGLHLDFEHLEEEISGYIERQEESYRIVVNSTHAETRRRFTAAHELGHYIFHRDLLGDGVGDNRAYRSEGTQHVNPNIRPIHERQANSFAANVLMPKHKLTDVGNRNTNELASLYLVSPEAMRIRLGR